MCINRIRRASAHADVLVLLNRYKKVGQKLTGLNAFSLETRSVMVAEIMSEMYPNNPAIVASGLLHNYYSVRKQLCSCIDVGHSVLTAAALDSLGFPLETTMPINQLMAARRYHYTKKLHHTHLSTNDTIDIEPYTREQMRWYYNRSWFTNANDLFHAIRKVDRMPMLPYSYNKSDKSDKSDKYDINVYADLLVSLIKD